MLSRRGRRGRKAPSAVPAVLLTVFLTALSVTAAPPAVADEIRDEQRWVLDALNVEEAWKVTRGAGVTVAVVDGEVDGEVAELRGRVVPGPGMGTQAAGDERLSGMRHATAMASLIAGAGKGGDDGLLGVAPEARILSLPLNFEEREDVPEADQRTLRGSPVARAIRYAADHGAQVISMSLGAYGPHRAEREAVSYALSKGVVLIAAVGNEGGEEYSTTHRTSYWNFPAGYPGVVGVGAADRFGQPAVFSSDNLSVLVSAPGVQVPVVLPGGKYANSDGTSVATALVAGVAALIKAKYPDMTPQQVSRALTSTAGFTPGAGYDEHVGFGVVDAGAALARAGELAGVASPPPVADGRHFGGGPLPEEPAPPGADPFLLWLYGAGLALGVLAFVGAVVVLNRKSGVRSAAGTGPDTGFGAEGRV
ncbi:S8 family serine peptidase [Planobispora siamensis]|uniref:Type VII secretion-associated serine protease n=1 Tax=Planobispora siamensis TaxID=936338 RepID=A0A8J3WJ85_9ACTN|nr:S8 family serine peptidase [Planobispora siamensis]GIH91383.1 type VII secretion-associated serine protease [Planobispora siamensis]